MCEELQRTLLCLDAPVKFRLMIGWSLNGGQYQA